MNKRDLAKLQTLIWKSADAHAAAHRAAGELDEFCMKHYGTTPSDEDADYIIDACLGGCGVSDGMKAEEFDAIMKEFR